MHAQVRAPTHVQYIRMPMRPHTVIIFVRSPALSNQGGYNKPARPLRARAATTSQPGSFEPGRLQQASQTSSSQGGCNKPARILRARAATPYSFQPERMQQASPALSSQSDSNKPGWLFRARATAPSQPSPALSSEGSYNEPARLFRAKATATSQPGPFEPGRLQQASLARSSQGGGNKPAKLFGARGRLQQARPGSCEPGQLHPTPSSQGGYNKPPRLFRARAATTSQTGSLEPGRLGGYDKWYDNRIEAKSLQVWYSNASCRANPFKQDPENTATSKQSCPSKSEFA